MRQALYMGPIHRGGFRRARWQLKEKKSDLLACAILCATRLMDGSRSHREGDARDRLGLPWVARVAAAHGMAPATSVLTIYNGWVRWRQQPKPRGLVRWRGEEGSASTRHGATEAEVVAGVLQETRSTPERLEIFEVIC